MLKNLGIDALEPGMYVVQVLRQTGNSTVLSEGLVRTPEAIAALKARGILEVQIDPERSLTTEGDDRPSFSEAASPGEPQAPRVAFDTELNRAAKLYNEAKVLQQKAFDDLQAGRTLEVAPMQDMASAMMESLFRNQDALMCMTRIREKDAYLLEHSINVSILMTVFARHLGFDEGEIHTMATGALLHDVGKVMVPGHILNKPGKLNPEEFAEMRRHVQYGIDALQNTEGLSDAAHAMVAQHHERLEGQGYPQQLAGEAIGKAGRMIAIVDSYDAITANRCYKEGSTSIRAFKILRDEAHAYDGALVTEFIRAMGVHPVGSLVRLKSGKLGLVIQSNKKDPLKPVVKVFYSVRLKQHVPITDIDLTDRKHDDEIETSVRPEDFKVNLPAFFKAVFFGG